MCNFFFFASSAVDRIPPVITGDGTVTVTTPLGSGGRVVVFPTPSATDNSGTAILVGSTHSSGDFFPTGTTTVTYTYRDPSGNTMTYDFDVVVNEGSYTHVYFGILIIRPAQTVTQNKQALTQRR